MVAQHFSIELPLVLRILLQVVIKNLLELTCKVKCICDI